MTAVSAAPAVQCPACTVPGRATTLTLAVPDGRVATLLRNNYWLTQYLSVSSILHKAPVKYARPTSSRDRRQ